jgi:hypothetical protein
MLELCGVDEEAVSRAIRDQNIEAKALQVACIDVVSRLALNKRRVLWAIQMGAKQVDLSAGEINTFRDLISLRLHYKPEKVFKKVTFRLNREIG